MICQSYLYQSWSVFLAKGNPINRLTVKCDILCLLFSRQNIFVWVQSLSRGTEFNPCTKNQSGCCRWDIQWQLCTWWVDLPPPWKYCSCISSIGNFCNTQMSSFSLTSCFLAHGDKKKTKWFLQNLTPKIEHWNH